MHTRADARHRASTQARQGKALHHADCSVTLHVHTHVMVDELLQPMHCYLPVTRHARTAHEDAVQWRQDLAVRLGCVCHSTTAEAACNTAGAKFSGRKEELFRCVHELNVSVHMHQSIYECILYDTFYELCNSCLCVWVVAHVRAPETHSSAVSKSSALIAARTAQAYTRNSSCGGSAASCAAGTSCRICLNNSTACGTVKAAAAAVEVVEVALHASLPVCMSSCVSSSIRHHVIHARALAGFSGSLNPAYLAVVTSQAIGKHQCIHDMEPGSLDHARLPPQRCGTLRSCNTTHHQAAGRKKYTCSRGRCAY